jgi:hypothetical protein
VCVCVCARMGVGGRCTGPWVCVLLRQAAQGTQTAMMASRQRRSCAPLRRSKSAHRAFECHRHAARADRPARAHAPAGMPPAPSPRAPVMSIFGP